MGQIAGELYVSHNTVRTHITHLYAKLGTHTRAQAVARARALGLLAPSRCEARPRVLADGRGQAGLAGGVGGPHAGPGELASPAGSGAGPAPDRSARLTRITNSAMIGISARMPAETRKPPGELRPGPRLWFSGSGGCVVPVTANKPRPAASAR